MSKYEVRDVIAMSEGFDSETNTINWYYNETFYIGTFETCAKNEKKAFTNYLKKHGITFKKNRIRINDYFDFMEIVDRKSYEPLFCAICKD